MFQLLPSLYLEVIKTKCYEVFHIFWCLFMSLLVKLPSLVRPFFIKLKCLCYISGSFRLETLWAWESRLKMGMTYWIYDVIFQFAVAYGNSRRHLKSRHQYQHTLFFFKGEWQLSVQVIKRFKGNFTSSAFLRFCTKTHHWVPQEVCGRGQGPPTAKQTRPQNNLIRCFPICHA